MAGNRHVGIPVAHDKKKDRLAAVFPTFNRLT